MIDDFRQTYCSIDDLNWKRMNYDEELWLQLDYRVHQLSQLALIPRKNYTTKSIEMNNIKEIITCSIYF